jgi:transposase InsO family protein
MRNEFSILALCQTLDVSTSGYYDWRQRCACPGLRALEDQTLAQEIGRIHTRSRQTYGSPRVMRELRKAGRRHGRHRIARLMKQKGLCGRQKGRHRVQTTDSKHDHPIAPTVWRRVSVLATPYRRELWTVRGLGHAKVIARPQAFDSRRAGADC